MNPPFGKSNIYTRAGRLLRRFFSGIFRKARSFRPSRPTMGKVWLRLSYFEEKMIRLDEHNREIFIENFYHSMRQVNYITLLTVFVIIATYLTTFQFRMIGFWEGAAVEGLLIFTLFYIVWYYRMGMEDLLEYLLRTETVPDYAFRPKLGPRSDPKPVEAAPPWKQKGSGKDARKR